MNNRNCPTCNHWRVCYLAKQVRCVCGVVAGPDAECKNCKSSFCDVLAKSCEDYEEK